MWSMHLPRRRLRVELEFGSMAPKLRSLPPAAAGRRRRRAREGAADRALSASRVIRPAEQDRSDDILFIFFHINARLLLDVGAGLKLPDLHLFSLDILLVVIGLLPLAASDDHT